MWHHLIYAYLIESTGVFEMFAEVVRRLVRRRDARHAVAGRRAAGCGRTEELFFRDPPLFSIAGITSEARP